MRKEAITVDFHDGNRELIVIGDVTQTEYGRYLMLGCSIRPYKAYNKNGIPVVNNYYRCKSADLIQGAKLHMHDVSAVKKNEIVLPGITLTLDNDFPFVMMKFHEGGSE